MANSTISALSDGAPPVFDDYVVVARTGSLTRKISFEDLGAFDYLAHPLRRSFCFDDLINQPGTSGSNGMNRLVLNSGTVNNNAIDTGNRPGVQRLSSAASANAQAQVVYGLTSASAATMFALGQGISTFQAAINIATLSTSAERYQLLIGWYGTANAATQSNGAFLLYDEGGVSTGSAASANWQTVSCAGGSRTYQTSNLAVATGWLVVQVQVNAGASSVSYKVNGSALNVSPNTTNIASGTAQAVGCGVFLIKSVGTTARTVDVDYGLYEIDFTSART